MPVTFLRTAQGDVEIECIVDTGFEGSLTLPASVVAILGLPFVTDLNTTLASDEAFVVPVHRASIRWDGRVVNVAILPLGRQPLLGTALLADHRLEVEFIDGGMVAID